MKFINPKIRKNLENIVLEQQIIDGDLVDLLVAGQFVDFYIHDIEFNGCKFIDVDFSKFPLRNVSLIDCVFEKCNLSGCDFSTNGVHRTRFDKCNMVGCDFVSCSLSDVSIWESKCNYINFSDSKIKHFILKDSVVKDGRFVSAELQDICFDEDVFDSCEFLNTKLKDIDFSNCNISNIGVSAADIKGIIVNEEQAIMLVALLGIIIK